MAARRSNKRTRHRRGRFGFLYKALSVVLILAAMIAGCIVFFRVNNVVVSGESKYAASEIIAVTGVQQGDNLLLLPRTKIAQKLRGELPYISQVNLRWSLPDTLLINITECVPAAVIQGGEGWWVIDVTGKILEQVSAPAAQPGLIQVTGVTALLPTISTKLALGEENAAKQTALSDLLAALQGQEMLAKVTEIDLSAAARLTFLYDGRIRVELPLVDDFDTKLWGLNLAMEHIQDNESGTLDLSRDVGERWPFQPDK